MNILSIINWTALTILIVLTNFMLQIYVLAWHNVLFISTTGAERIPQSLCLVSPAWYVVGSIEKLEGKHLFNTFRKKIKIEKHMQLTKHVYFIKAILNVLFYLKIIVKLLLKKIVLKCM